MKVRSNELLAEKAAGGVLDCEWHLVWCPGCDELHQIRTAIEGGLNRPPLWERTGPESFEPSLLVGGVQWAEGQHFHKSRHRVGPGERTVCHSFIRNGVWEFLSDSTHELAGQHVAMVDLPDWVANEP